jgi:uncharacterized protein
MSRRRHPAQAATTTDATSLAELDRWLQDRAERRPVATSMPMLDGYVAAIVAGPVSIRPLDWICRCSPSMPTPSTTAAPRNSRRSPPSCSTTTPSATPSRTTRSGSSRSICASRTATSIHVPGAWDSTPPCSRDYRLRRHCSTPATSITACCCPSCSTVWTIRGVRCSARKGPKTQEFLRDAHTDIPAVVEAMRRYWMPIRYARTG